jgi:hypothetical protein
MPTNPRKAKLRYPQKKRRILPAEQYNDIRGDMSQYLQHHDVLEHRVKNLEIAVAAVHVAIGKLETQRGKLSENETSLCPSIISREDPFLGSPSGDSIRSDGSCYSTILTKDDYKGWLDPFKYIEDLEHLGKDGGQ